MLEKVPGNDDERLRAAEAAIGEVQNVKRFMHLDGFVFILVPIFAAMMARGYGL